MKNKVAIVTGASRGIGRATAMALAAEGVKVVVDYYNDQELNAENVVADIVRNNGVAIKFKADVRQEMEIKSLVDFTLAQYGQIDFIINNAGIVYDKVWDTKIIEEWEDVYKTNTLSNFLMIKYAKESLVNSSQARVINISSTNATDRNSPFSMDYDASKAAVISLTKNMCIALSPKVNVNAVLPGWVNTKMNDGLDADFVKKETDKIALGRFAEPEEIADVIIFLCSEKAKYINGSCVVIDGGRSD